MITQPAILIITKTGQLLIKSNFFTVTIRINRIFFQSGNGLIQGERPWPHRMLHEKK
jgi:hypothetical protein